jgi:ScaI restriction endonuclease
MTKTDSPYEGKPEKAWHDITKRLLSLHPLKSEELLAVSKVVWQELWETTVGTGSAAVRLADLKVPATVVGYFFEVLFCKEMEIRYPGKWRANKTGDEKDLVCVPKQEYSIEIKTSGQLGTRIYGNRSYGQKLVNKQSGKKEKSGYYLTVNFHGRVLTYLRFGWIDATDWKPQASPTGQMAGLPKNVYDYKLIPIPGDYQLEAPVSILSGVGPGTRAKLEKLGLHTIRDLLSSNIDLSGRLAIIRAVNREAYGFPG